MNWKPTETCANDGDATVNTSKITCAISFMIVIGTPLEGDNFNKRRRFGSEVARLHVSMPMFRGHCALGPFLGRLAARDHARWPWRIEHCG